MISIILLTFNSAKSITRTLTPLLRLSDDIHVVDSFSEDDTVAICERAGCKVVQRPFQNYADQRNWAVANLTPRYDWQMHVDADEELEPALVDLIAGIDFAHTAHDGFLVGRKIVFLGRVLQYGGISKTWHCRIFRNGRGRCEDRLYDQHFVCDGKVGTLNGFMLDHQEDLLTEWTRRHNRWSDLEAAEVMAPSEEPSAGSRIKPELTGGRIQRVRYLKGRYYRLPLFLRPVLYFLYRYIIRLGFLDGTRGLVYNVLQGFWFRFLVDAKIYEKMLAQNAKERTS